MLTTQFQSRFHSPPSLPSQAPGRVNLIGEHTDYDELSEKNEDDKYKNTDVFFVARYRIYIDGRSDSPLAFI